MPTPIVHSAVAVAASGLAGRPLKSKETALLVLASNLPDLDLIPGIIAGRPMLYHHMASHSFAFAAGAAALLSLLPWGERKNLAGAPYPVRLNALMIVCLSHPLLDLFTAEMYYPGGAHVGLMLAWPFRPSYFGPYYSFFKGAYFTASWRVFLVPDNLRILGFDSLVALLILGLAFAFTRARSVPASAPENTPD